MEEFCKNLPKIELHAHVNGSLSPRILKELGCFDESILEYQKLNCSSERNPRTLSECFHLFKVAHDACKTKESVHLATTSVIEEFSKDNVVYLELRTTPRSALAFTKEQYIDTVVKAIKESRNDDIIVKLLLSIDRRHDSKTSNEVLNLIIKMKHIYPTIIKGVDFCGNPNEGSFDEKLFQKAKKNNLFLSLHCAEVKNDEEVLRMLSIRPERIGHGTCIHPNFGGSDKLWDEYYKQKIPLECCLTSNVICGTTKNFKQHHVSEWIQNCLPFSLGTDDKGVFATSLSQEYLLAHENFGLNKEDLWNVSYGCIDQSFASFEEKEKLKSILETWRNKNLM